MFPPSSLNPASLSTGRVLNRETCRRGLIAGVSPQAPSPGQHQTENTMARNSLTRRLSRIALIALIRSAATSLGSGLIGLFIWWITSR
jgi:plastocyanin domain-containing protein